MYPGVLLKLGCWGGWWDCAKFKAHTLQGEALDPKPPEVAWVVWDVRPRVDVQRNKAAKPEQTLNQS